MKRSGKTAIILISFLLAAVLALTGCGTGGKKDPDTNKITSYEVDYSDIEADMSVSFRTKKTFAVSSSARLVLFLKSDRLNALATGAAEISEVGPIAVSVRFAAISEVNRNLYVLRFETFKDDSYQTYIPQTEAIEIDLSLVKKSKPTDFAERKIQQKDIASVKIYALSGDSVDEVSTLTAADLEGKLQNYLASVSFADMPQVSAKIKAYESDGAESIKLTLESESFMYDRQGNVLPFCVSFPSVMQSAEKINALINELKNNASGTVRLTEDIDASGLKQTAAALVTSPFNGTLDGGGYMIKNLSSPLFAKLQNATVKSLTLKNVKIASGSNVAGALANECISSAVTDVHALNIFNNNSGNNRLFGGLIGSAQDSEISRCSAAGFSWSASLCKSMGGLVGVLKGGSLTDCYTQGAFANLANVSLSGTVGGMFGESIGAVRVSRCIANVSIATSVAVEKNVGGFFGNLDPAVNTVCSDNLSLGEITPLVNTTGSADKFAGNGKTDNLVNCYESASAKGQSGANGTTLTATLPDALKTSAFYTEKQGLSLTNWLTSLLKLSGTALPKGSFDLDGYFSGSDYLPDIERLVGLKDFDDAKTILYKNLYLLNPYQDTQYIVLDGANISAEHFLNAKPIHKILPLLNGVVINTVNSQTYAAPNEILLTYANDTTARYALSSPSLKNNIAYYGIFGEPLSYAYNRYVMNASNPFYNSLTQAVSQMDLATDVYASLGGDFIIKDVYKIYAGGSGMPGADSERYMLDKKFEQVKTEAAEFIADLLAFDPTFNYYLDSLVLVKLIQKNIADKIIPITFAYTYMRRWYDITVGPAVLSQMLFFRGDFYGTLDALELSQKLAAFDPLIATPAGDKKRTIKAANFTSDLYNEYIKPYVFGGANLVGFIERNVKIFTGSTDNNQWFTDNFKGVLTESPIDNPLVEYRAWAKIRNSNLGPNLILPLLSFGLSDEGEDMYIMSMPTQFAFGSLASYTDYFTVNGREKMQKALDTMGKNCAEYYNTLSTLIQPKGMDIVTRLNSINQVQIDSAKYNGGRFPCPISPSPTENNFYNAMMYGASANGSGAFANGYYVVWVVYSVIGDYNTFFHESTHNQDGSLYLEGEGRREGSGAESFAAGVFAPAHSGTEFSFNFNVTYNVQSNAATNLSSKRVDTQEKIFDFYHKYFETLYAIDLMELKALLSLDPAIQAAMLYQQNFGIYPETNTPTNTATIWKGLDVETYLSLNVKGASDVIDNRLNILRGVTPGGNISGGNDYGGTNYNSAFFYTACNPNGRPDWMSFKRFAFEMCGAYGYSDGVVNWLSFKNKNDLDALRQASGDATMTMEKFKKQRYAETQSQLDKYGDVTPYFSQSQIVDLFRAAYQSDYASGWTQNKDRGQRLREGLMKYILRQTDDFTRGAFEQDDAAVEISTAEQFVSALTKDPNGNFVLKNDLDFSKVAAAKGAYIEPIFTGRLRGNGNTIKNTKTALFQNVYYGRVEGVKVADAVIDKKDAAGKRANEAGAVANLANYAYFSDIDIVNANIKANGYAGGVVGKSAATQFFRINANVDMWTDGGYIGAITAESSLGMTLNCAVTGKVSGNGDGIGGLIGNSDRSVIAYNYVNLTLNQRNNGRIAGGLTGYLRAGANAYGNVTVIATDTPKVTARVYGNADAGAAAKMYANFEFDGSPAKSNVNIGNPALEKTVRTVSESKLKNLIFYDTELGFRSDNWDFSKVSSGIVTAKTQPRLFPIN